MLGTHVNLLLLAAENVVGHWRAYLVAAAGLVLPLALLLCGVAVSEGLKADAVASVDAGADLYCTWDMFGRDAPLPLDKIAPLADIDGVTRAVPRIIGRTIVGSAVVLVVGVPLDQIRRAAPQVDGRLPADGSEVLIGNELARITGLSPGKTIALDAHSLRLFTVVGVVRSTSTLWSAKAVVCDIDEAATVFGESGHVTDVCLYARAGYESLAAESIERVDDRYRVQTKSIVHNYVVRGMSIREGVFTILFALALAWAIPSFAILTYMGHTPRRREIGLLKAEGWRTAHVLEMVACENVIVAVFAAASATFIAIVWLRVFRAPLIAPFFVPDLPLFPNIVLPARFLPLPGLLALVFSLVVTMTGSIYTTWRTSITRPVDTLR
ncbi:MAG: FtsX-like permease family protein [Phycisphaerales bacterium]|nr:FtsX-like permease family protein [Phycisphaerales bacterium]